jgi:RHS repeat-associated protein
MYPYDSAIGTYTYNGIKTYTYDHTSQVIGDTGSTFTYDAQGNRTMPGYATGAANRLTNDGVFTYAYDAEGNRISKSKGSELETWYYAWDNRNRLIGVEQTSDDANILLAVTYAYDAHDKLVAEEKWQSSTGVVAIRRHWDGGDLWAITDASNVVSQRLLYGEGVDQVQGRIVEAGANAGTQGFYATDHLGSVRDIIDAATGEVLYHAEYDAFGAATEYGAGYGDTLKYTARELDADTGLQYNRARWYDNSVGRWLSEDPIGFAAGDHNLYRYVSNFSTGATDPSGLAAIKKKVIGGRTFLYYVYNWASFESNQYIGILNESTQRVHREGYEAEFSVIETAVNGWGYNVTSDGWARYIKDNAVNRDILAEVAKTTTPARGESSYKNLVENTINPNYTHDRKLATDLGTNVAMIGEAGTGLAVGGLMSSAWGRGMGRSVIENATAVSKADKLVGRQKESYERTILELAAGIPGQKDHPLKNMDGLRSRDLAGSGKGRGSLRILYKIMDDGKVVIHDILDTHK